MASRTLSVWLLATSCLISSACIDVASPNLSLSRLELRHFARSVAVEDAVR